MSRTVRLLLLVLLVAGVLDVLLAVRIAGRDRAAQLELGRHKLTALSDATRARLASLQDSVLLTLYASPRDAMPSEMRRLEGEARDVFEALKAAGGGRVEYQIVDPTADAALEKFAGRRKVAPVRVRTVDRDGWSEKTVWASLGVTYGARPPVVYNGLRPEQLPLLQDLLVAQLDQLEHPRKAKIALAVRGGDGEGFKDFAEDLASKADLQRVDLDGGAPFPRDADVLFWIEPAPVDASRVHELQLFLQAGHSVVLAGSPQLGPFSQGLVTPPSSFAPRPVPCGLDTLLSGFGLSQQEGVLGDTMSAVLKAADQEVHAAWLLRCIGPQQDFHTFKGQPNGHLYFETPAPFALDGERLRAQALTADILGTSSDNAWLQPAASVKSLTEIAASQGTPAPRVPLMVSLRPADPWQGLLVALAAPTPFEDGWYKTEGNAHPRLVKVLLDNMTSDERLLAGGLLAERAEPLPELPAASRALWRALCVGLLPLVLIVIGLLRGAFRGGERGPRIAGAARPVRAAALRLVLGGAVVALVVAATRGTGLRTDLTADHVHELAPRAEQLAAAATGPRAVHAELLFSAPERLPPALRGLPARITDQLAELQRAGASIRVETRRPEDLSAAEQAALVAQGIAPVELSTHDEEVTAVRRVWASLRLSTDEGRSTVVAFGGAVDADTLPFRLAFALWRLQDGHPVHVGFASDAPRLTAAEAYELYQQQGLFAPNGTDVYALAAEALSAVDFDVSHVNPRDAVLPKDLDALVWLQPRRSIEHLLEQTVLYLHGGGHVLLGAQQFVMQPRQFPGRDYMTVWWPAPQTPDVDRIYFPDLGLQLVREVLFDQLKTSAPIETLVYAGTRRDARRQESALPFLLRVSAANFCGSPITRGLSDLAFLCPAYLHADDAVLAAHGLSARPLFTCSEQSWSYEWKAGYLDPAVLDGPAHLAGDGPQPHPLGRVPLGLDVTGQFPLPDAPIVAAPMIPGPDGTPQPGPPRVWPPPDAPAPHPGRLIYLADTECLKNYRLLDPEFRSDTLLVNAVAALTLDEGLAAIAAQRPAPRGLPVVEPDVRLHWRAAVLGGFPLAMLAGGALWLMARRRAPRRTEAR